MLFNPIYSKYYHFNIHSIFETLLITHILFPNEVFEIQCIFHIYTQFGAVTAQVLRSHGLHCTV